MGIVKIPLNIQRQMKMNKYKVIVFTIVTIIVLACVCSIQAAKAVPEREQEKQVSSAVNEEDPCAICLSELRNEDVTCTPCMHLFHTNCLRQALTIKKVCPLCRTDFTIDHQDFLHAVQIPLQGVNHGWAHALVIEPDNDLLEFAGGHYLAIGPSIFEFDGHQAIMIIPNDAVVPIGDEGGRMVSGDGVRP
jgi:hypothetical protein